MEKILIDTSVWVSFLRGKDKPLVEEVANLITRGQVCLTGIILVELLQGALHEAEFQRILKLLEPVERIDPSPSQWQKAGLLSFRLRRKGLTPSTVDVLLTLLAIENDCFLYTQDKHFTLVAQHSDLRLYTEDQET